MLGDTEYFDEFPGSTYDRVATVLLVVYLVILTIMMLNLLVAVLSTAHAKVDKDADLEYKVRWGSQRSLGITIIVVDWRRFALTRPRFSLGIVWAVERVHRRVLVHQSKRGWRE